MHPEETLWQSYGLVVCEELCLGSAASDPFGNKAEMKQPELLHNCSYLLVISSANFDFLARMQPTLHDAASRVRVVRVRCCLVKAITL